MGKASEALDAKSLARVEVRTTTVAGWRGQKERTFSRPPKKKASTCSTHNTRLMHFHGSETCERSVFFSSLLHSQWAARWVHTDTSISARGARMSQIVDEVLDYNRRWLYNKSSTNYFSLPLPQRTFYCFFFHSRYFFQCALQVPQFSINQQIVWRSFSIAKLNVLVFFSCRMLHKLHRSTLSKKNLNCSLFYPPHKCLETIHPLSRLKKMCAKILFYIRDDSVRGWWWISSTTEPFFFGALSTDTSTRPHYYILMQSIARIGKCMMMRNVLCIAQLYLLYATLWFHFMIISSPSHIYVLITASFVNIIELHCTFLCKPNEQDEAKSTTEWHIWRSFVQIKREYAEWENIAKERKMDSNFIKYMYTNTCVPCSFVLFWISFPFTPHPPCPSPSTAPHSSHFISTLFFFLLAVQSERRKKATNARCVDESSSLSTSLFVRTRVEVRRRAVAGECETSIRLNSVHRCEPPRDFENFSCKRCSCICRGAYVWADDEEGKRARSPSDKNILKRFMVCCACWPYICCQIGLRRRPATSRERKNTFFSLTRLDLLGVVYVLGSLKHTELAILAK